jgi:CheY-like chemotaxis protein
MTAAPLEVLLASSDLMLLARIDGAVRAAQGKLHTVSAADEAVARAAAMRPRLVILDLRLAGLDVGATVAGLRAALGADAYVAACGPHVHEASLTAARVAGCDEVLTRGQIDRDVAGLIARSQHRT